MRVVIAGAGLAGFRVAESLRSGGFDGSLVLVGAERRPPYDRPPLSKKVLLDPGVDPSLQADFAALGVDFRAGEEALGFDGGTSGGGTSGGGTSGGGGALRTNRDKYVFNALVVATGARPVALPGPGRQRFLRTYDDALELRAVLRPGVRLAIVGAGWIGAELATAAASLGCAVTVVEAGSAPLATALGADVGSRTAAWYASNGVELRTGVAVASVEDGGLALAGGEWLPADEVVTAVGVRPNVEWLAGSGVTLSNGVAVDGALRASVPGVYAAGDCAAFESGRFGRRLRVEHWDVALHAPEVIADRILGGASVYDPVPYFWSEQFGRMMQYVGYHGDADRLVWRGSPSEPKWGVCWLRGTRLVALLSVGRPRDLLQGRRAIESGASVDVGRLADPAIPVKDAAAS
jgi:3-phenylpropionate/trans-cinnamate dioxygenase ferredoxin reductase subunit